MTTETTEPKDHQELLKQIEQLGEAARDRGRKPAYVQMQIVKEISASVHVLDYICKDLKKCEGAGTARVVAFEMLRYSTELQRRIFDLLNDEGVRNG